MRAGQRAAENSASSARANLVRVSPQPLFGFVESDELCPSFWNSPVGAKSKAAPSVFLCLARTFVHSPLSVLPPSLPVNPRGTDWN